MVILDSNINKASWGVTESQNMDRLLEMAAVDINTIPKVSRRQLADFWATQALEERIDQLFEATRRYEAARGQLAKVHDEIDRRVLQTADVVGVTTTGLARKAAVLQKLQSKVTICEEAGEVLEAHMLSALLPTVEHSIQIGDHQQLRPQINNYKLSLESPHGHNFQLDRSQFERLAVGVAEAPGVPIAQLNVQRRMRPQISTLLRETIYPNLVDHAAVHELPSVVGMRDKFLWLDHTNQEDSAGLDLRQKSHANAWEVDIVHVLVRHVVRQGIYKSDEIAVLTPYTGQLQSLRAKLRDDFEIVVSEKDQEALAKEGFDGVELYSHPDRDLALRPLRPLEKKRMSELLRIATVDNFQGEEAKVIIVSLVRSNKEKKVGFLRTTNRINVLLSRAQHGMYLIGNADTYCAVPMWAKVVGMLRATDSVGESFRLCCPRHAETEIKVSQPEDFARLSPEGGCRLICDRRLEDCGHQCQARCHSEAMHQTFPCQQPCRRLYSQCGHHCRKATCGEPCGPCTTRLDGVALLCNHTKDKIPYHQAQSVEKISCTFFVEKLVPGCGHAVEVPYSVDVQAVGFKCPIKCDKTLTCGHECSKTCGECRNEKADGSVVFDHGRCAKLCGRPFGTCNHICKKPCHVGEDCGLCMSRCEVSIHLLL